MKIIEFISKNKFLIILFLIVISATVIRWHYMLLVPILCDEPFSIYAAKAMIENGIPVLPSGAIYARDLLYHALFTLSIILFGENIVAYRLVNFIFGTLILILVYFFAKKFTNKYIAIFAVLFLAISRFENSFIYSMRMYAQFQFFWLLTVYCFYNGIIKGNYKYKILTFLSYLASLFSHLATISLLPILGLYLLFKKRDFYKDKIILAGSILIIFVSLLLFFVKIPGALDAFIYTKTFGFSLNSLSFYPHFLIFSSLCFSVFIFISFIKLIKNKEEKRLYLFWIFLTSFFIVSIFSKTKSISYLAYFFPLYVILVLLGIDDFRKLFFNKIKIKKEYIFSLMFFIVLLFSIAPFAISGNFAHCPFGFKSIVKNSESSNKYIFENKKENDLIISTIHSETLFYFGWENKDKIYLLVEKNIGGKFQEFSDGVTLDPYFNIVLIDSLDKLKDFLKKNERVWILTDYRVHWLVSPEINKYIEEKIELKYSDELNEAKVYFYENSTKRISN